MEEASALFKNFSKTEVSICRLFLDAFPEASVQIYFYFCLLGGAAFEVNGSHLTSSERTSLDESLEVHRVSLHLGNLDPLKEKSVEIHIYPFILAEVF